MQVSSSSPCWTAFTVKTNVLPLTRTEFKHTTIMKTWKQLQNKLLSHVLAVQYEIPVHLVGVQTLIPAVIDCSSYHIYLNARWFFALKFGTYICEVILNSCMKHWIKAWTAKPVCLAKSSFVNKRENTAWL